MSARNDAVHQDKDESSSAPEQRIPTLPRVESSSQATFTNATSTGTEEPDPSDQSIVSQTIRPYQAPTHTVDPQTALNGEPTEEAKDGSPSSPSSCASASDTHPTFGEQITDSPVPTLTTGASATDEESIRTGSVSHVARMLTGPNRGRTRRTGIPTGATDETERARRRVAALRRAATDPNRVVAMPQGPFPTGVGLGLVEHDDPIAEVAVFFADTRIYDALLLVLTAGVGP